MSRKFDLPHPQRSLRICVSPIDEAWEFWLCQRGRRLSLAAVVSVDAAIEAWGQGKDPILLMAERIKAAVGRGEIALPDDAQGVECQTSCPDGELPLLRAGGRSSRAQGGGHAP